MSLHWAALPLGTRNFWEKRRFIALVYLLAALVVSAQKILLGGRADGYTSYENYVIFRNSFWHLVQGLNPYAAFPAEQWDLFKYSPAFALAMAPFAALPDWLGLSLWNALNALLLLAAIVRLPMLDDRQRAFFAWFVLPELVVALQNSQSNGLTAGLMLWAFVAFERHRPAQAAGWIAAATFIKIFGIFAVLPAILYPRKPRFAFWLIGWVLLLSLIPLVVLSPGQLVQVYADWLDLLRSDRAASVGLSVQGWLQTWFGWQPSKASITATGLGLLSAAVLSVYLKPTTLHRFWVYASVLLWVVIFNHKAESPTFIIAMCGVALWYSVSEKRMWEKTLLWTTFALVSLTPTDIFPSVLREQVVQPYVLKALPCILIWSIITFYLIRNLFIHARTVT